MDNNLGIMHEISSIVRSRDLPDPELVKKHGVKTGLRNEDGTGVVVGISSKGKVVGYKKDPVTSEKTDCDGELYYCGIWINDLVNLHSEHFGFEEATFLLLTGQLPTKRQLNDFSEYMSRRRALSMDYRDKLFGIVNDNVMNSLQLAVTKLYGEDINPDSTSAEDVLRQSIDLIAKFPCLVAYAYHAAHARQNGKEPAFVDSTTGGSHAENFLHLFRAGGSYTKEEARLIDLFLILHAEHGGGNNSTFTVRTVSSSETDTYSAITAGIASLKGQLHGGANEKVMEMMEHIKKNVSDWEDREEIAAFLEKIMKKEAGDRSGKVYGIGHAVYTLSDPRARIMKEMAAAISRSKGRLREFELLKSVGEIAPQVFEKLKGSKKKVAPNVDFYSGFVLDCMGIPSKLFTPLFAMARVSGWCAHRIEQLAQNRIMRPAYLNFSAIRPYIPIDERDGSEKF